MAGAVVKRGGPRPGMARKPGAGRPPSLSTQLERVEKVAKELQAAVRSGVDLLGGNYTSIMEAHIRKALEEDDSTAQRFLLDLLPRLAAQMPSGEDSPFEQLRRKWEGELHLHQHIHNEKPGSSDAIPD